jgi:hypothetical protein
MRHTHRNRLLGLVLGLLVPVAAGAQSTPPPVLDWGNADGSGWMFSSGGALRLGGTTGQPDAVASTGGVYRLSGGFWTLPQGGAPTDAGDLPALPTQFAFALPSPNPFTVSTVIELALPVAGKVEVEVFGIAGERVRTLADGERPAGIARLSWDGRDDGGSAMPAGIYFARVRVPGHQAVRRIVKVH